MNSITSSPDGTVYLSDTDTTSVGRIFNGRLSYNKGAMVLHMLRKKLGDKMFFQGMKDYLADPSLAYNYAKTPDFIAKMEAASGQNLFEFFNDWIYNQGYPSYTINWYQPQPNEIKITINQTQSHSSVSYFEAPVPVRVLGSGGEILELVLDNKFNGEEFLESVNFEVTEILIDPEVHLISKFNNAVLGLEDLILESEFSIYPNPASTAILIIKPNYIELENITIYNSLGQIESEISKKDQIEVSQLIPGVYFLKIQSNQGIIHKSFLKY